MRRTFQCCMAECMENDNDDDAADLHVSRKLVRPKPANSQSASLFTRRDVPEVVSLLRVATNNSIMQAKCLQNACKMPANCTAGSPHLASTRDAARVNTQACQPRCAGRSRLWRRQWTRPQREAPLRRLAPTRWGLLS